MKTGILAAAVLAAVLSATGGASAMSVTHPFSFPVERAIPVQETAVYCGPLGCGPIWPGPRHWVPAWGPWGPTYRPACPLDYYYACRRGPLGYRQCACWPYPGR
jgi:hypothetical protein